MRPLKDLLVEEYWDIGYRFYDENDSVVSGEKKKFDLLKANKRFWYADPFLFEKDGQTFLFVEMFDNVTEVGLIGYSRFENGKFTEPVPVIKESFHLSYPYVFEKDGMIYMMPETHEDGCIQLYEAVTFPTEWKKSKTLVNEINAVDTVIENGMLIASVVCPENDMSVDLGIYGTDGKEMSFSPVYRRRLDKRGAGRCFSYKNMRIRPAQGCENGNYGGKIIFNKITQCDENGYSEDVFSVVTPEKIITPERKPVMGIHTYAKTDKIEIADIKRKRLNFRRIIWIIMKKI